MDVIKKKASEIFAKIKSIKHIEVIIAIIAVALMIIVFTGIGTKSSEKTSKSSTATDSAATTTNSEESIAAWEKKLSEILSKIDGVGKAEVMITAKGTNEKITANTTTTATSNSSGGASNTTNTTISPVIVNNNGTSEPYIVKELMPEIIGVIVVAEGADNAVNKLLIMRAVQTALSVDSGCVEIYPMKR